MSDGSGIQWTDATWNPVVGCTRVSAGCDHCYAVRQSYRLERMGQAKYAGLTVLNGAGDRHFNGVVRCVPADLSKPLGWAKPRRVFVNSMSDLFHREVPFEFLDEVFAVMLACGYLENRRHTFQVLTKRPERAAEYLASRSPAEHLQAWAKAGDGLVHLDDENVLFSEAIYAATCHDWDERGTNGSGSEHKDWGYTSKLFPLPNVWLGTSCEDQAAADERVPHLLRCLAAVRFLSCEPLLAPIDLDRNIGGTRWIGGQRGCGGRHHGIGTPECPRELHHHHDERCKPGLDWIIVGGESGKDARPCHIDWLRSIVSQCRAAGVPCFVKQLGKWVGGAEEHVHSVHRYLLRGEDGTTGTWTRPILRSDYSPEIYDNRPANAIAWNLGDEKGGNINEWPEDLRVREFPGGGVAEGAAAPSAEAGSR